MTLLEICKPPRNFSRKIFSILTLSVQMEQYSVAEKMLRFSD